GEAGGDLVPGNPAGIRRNLSNEKPSQSLMLPTLKALSDGVESPLSAIRERVASAENLTSEDRQETLPSGQSVLSNRVNWAITYLARAGLLERVRRGVYRLTEDGGRLLSRSPARIDKQLLQEYSGFAEWVKGSSKSPSQQADDAAEQTTESTDTPEEVLEKTVQGMGKALEADVLDRVRAAQPEFFEQVVVDLLIAMGYGGGDATRGRVTGCSGDGGIDGTIQEDVLGLDEIYIQAKKYADGNTVGAGVLRNFAGALVAAGTNKGVFVTTSGFTPPASRLPQGIMWKGVRSASS
ncbi:MAG: restriction endonuclease, partial [Gammaproteobacteria bacterium]|nr:restriction endonuclease [Gammaproteobacteria bacterium]